MIQTSVKYPLAKLIEFVCCHLDLEAKVMDQVTQVDTAARVICDTKRASALASRVKRNTSQKLFKTSQGKAHSTG